ncbi:MAG: anti-sigma factor family protein, partial [Aureliella sp.]
MQPEFEEHLLSAYLDEELSADERALVEQRLAVDPVARELLEDLKRLRGLVATLPAWNGQDLAFDALPLNRTDDHDSGASLDGSGSERTSLSTSEDLTSALTRPSAQVDRSRYQTRRSMRWTAMVALAAGIATVAFGLPYLVPGLKPAQDLALLKKGDQPSPPTGGAAVEPPPTASSPVASAPAAAGQLDGASESFYLRPEPK